MCYVGCCGLVHCRSSHACVRTLACACGAARSEAKAGKLKTFEVPKAVHLEAVTNELGQGFSVENDLLTPTFKVKRPQLLQKYQQTVNQMYTKLGEKVVG